MGHVRILYQSLRGGKRKSQKFHLAFRMGFKTRQANELLPNTFFIFSQKRIKPMVLSLFERDFKKNSIEL